MIYELECWATNKKEDSKVKVAEMKKLRWMCGMTNLNRRKNEYKRGSLWVTNIAEKIKENNLRSFEYVKRRNNDDIDKKINKKIIKGNRVRGKPKKK